MLASELSTHPVTVRRHLAALRRSGYLRYAPTRGSGQLFEIAIEKYDRHFEDQARALHGPLHVRAVSAHDDRQTAVPKKKEGRSVRFADRDVLGNDLLFRRSQTRAREARDDDQSPQHPTAWTRTGARRGDVPQPSYPAGVTRLR